MHTHPTARLTTLGPERLVRQRINEVIPLAELLSEVGISRRTAYNWFARYRTGRPAALMDRRSVRRSHRRTLDLRQYQLVRALRHERCTTQRIAKDQAALL
jgi:hypothetical protein